MKYKQKITYHNEFNDEEKSLSKFEEKSEWMQRIGNYLLQKRRKRGKTNLIKNQISICLITKWTTFAQPKYIWY